MTAPAPPNLDQLLVHAAWLRRLAHWLCRDPHLANDLTQDTIVAALCSRDTAPHSRQWFAGILRHLWHRHLRREGGRAAREARAAPEPTLPSTAETMARVETQRRLATEVLALKEPERSAVLWHAKDAVLQLANFEGGGMTVSMGSGLRDGKSRVYARPAGWLGGGQRQI